MRRVLLGFAYAGAWIVVVCLGAAVTIYVRLRSQMPATAGGDFSNARSGAFHIVPWLFLLIGPALAIFLWTVFHGRRP